MHPPSHCLTALTPHTHRAVSCWGCWYRCWLWGAAVSGASVGHGGDVVSGEMGHVVTYLPHAHGMAWHWSWRTVAHRASVGWGKDIVSSGVGCCGETHTGVPAVQCSVEGYDFLPILATFFDYSFLLRVMVEREDRAWLEIWVDKVDGSPPGVVLPQQQCCTQPWLTPLLYSFTPLLDFFKGTSADLNCYF